ncbi:Hypp4171 [Branchiostoma lanceolatum]|uniref:Hypp4171 protein n=1 Tax=Branchiostoma lanceolatum TaxID=7740 RepID=A0A8K0EUL7_BRALA|nr:Hypp4171 [Branchiostoma lanceolatum]
MKRFKYTLAAQRLHHNGQIPDALQAWWTSSPGMTRSMSMSEGITPGDAKTSTKMTTTISQLKGPVATYPSVGLPNVLGAIQPALLGCSLEHLAGEWS